MDIYFHMFVIWKQKKKKSPVMISKVGNPHHTYRFCPPPLRLPIQNKKQTNKNLY